MSHQIKKTIELKASIEKVWEALTDYKKFGEWFQVELESPFVVGEATQGVSTHPECQMKWYASVKEIKPMTLFSYVWPQDESRDESSFTRVEFRLEESETGTSLTMTESGFDRIPEDIRKECLRRNEGGWVEQMKNIENYVSGL